MNYAILVAAGSGNRMNSQIPKQYMLLKDKPLLYYTVHRFLQFDPTLIIILVLPEGDQQGRQMMEQYFPSAENIRYIAGGSTRFHSVQNGLRAIPDEEGIVWIHDGVRPFVSEAVLKRCRNMALEQGVAIPAIQLKDSLRKVMKTESQALNRSEIVAIQTPQTFQIKTIKKAFETQYQESFTDEASVLEWHGGKIVLVEGNEENFKITTPFDFQMAACLLEQDPLFS